MDKVDEINLQINRLSEASYEAEDIQHQLKRTEEALKIHFRRRTQFFYMLQDYWRTGDMAHRVADRKYQLQQEEHQIMDALTEKQIAVCRQIKEFETLEDELYRARKQAWEEVE
ncbi:DUF3958 family protein [Listeria booriae]|uniref:DUF3958 family protein n=1 Tax=Listeria booriae TaxID=1552123 RepID=A0A7X0XD39_9LIST|nr:DUF3958 family protein [Listeria booriae]MBC1491501.1 DUF3958 family protein [Listeria booriae]MBC1505064.1 DUF3958 family protein [Listeria booriae]MBC1531578.1 DUF3958 family protein [Listeria booriae]MBC6136298.1 DUF3958 family protein [Listeria booriae]